VNEVFGGLTDPFENDKSSRTSVKRAWSYLKVLRTENCGILTLLSRDNQICNTDLSKPEALQDQFDSVFTTENANSLPDLPFHSTRNMYNIIISTAGVTDQLQKINPHKTTGPDGLLPFGVRIYCPLI
jgi:hypothetical protein